jgi:hypothetical protein
MIAMNGYDGFMYSVGFLVAYLTVLFIVAEPLRNAGKYTMADVLAYRLKPRPVRAAASLMRRAEARGQAMAGIRADLADEPAMASSVAEVASRGSLGANMIPGERAKR